MLPCVKSLNVFTYSTLIYLHLTWLLLATPQFGGQQLPQQTAPSQQQSSGPLGGNGAPTSIGGVTHDGEKSDENYTVHFFLFDASGPTLRDQLVLMDKNGSVPDLWKRGGAVKVIAHGYHADYTLTPLQHLEDHKMPVIAEEYAKANSSINVILVEWSALAIRLAYPISAENTKIVGKATAEFLVNLYKQRAFNHFADVHVIGFSLGSHVAGVAGYHVQQLSNGLLKIGRITGLDPAGPLFDLDGGLMPTEKSGFLEASDADFVDIIHCNMGTQHWSRAIPEGRLGSFVQAGHADFYPNGGMTQIFQCTSELDKMTGCSHRCCVFYYAFSLSRPELACPCKTWEDYANKLCSCDASTGVYMGDPCSPKAAGKYFVEMREDLNMTSIIPKELPPLNPDQSAQQVASRVDKVGADGVSPNAVTNRMESTKTSDASVPVPDASNVQGASIPQGAPQTGAPSLPGGSTPQGAAPRTGATPNVQSPSLSGAAGPQTRSGSQGGGSPLSQGTPGMSQQSQGPQGQSIGGMTSQGEKTDSGENDTVHFFLWDQSKPTLEEQLVLMDENGSVPIGLWVPGGALKVIAHGYHADYTLTPLQHLDDHKIQVITTEYAKANSSLNVIVVEWSALAIRLAYPISAENTKIVGKATAEFLLNLHKEGAITDFANVHVIGFSLGSHVAGVCGYQLQQMSNNTLKLGRITGLDPAGPLFDLDGGFMPPDTTGFLEASDADFVDIIHCNMGTQHWSRAIPEGRLGSFVNAGHADFYPNGGMTQIFQCTTQLDIMSGCSHRCCVFYYAFSLTRPELACPCNSWEDYSNKLCSCDETTGVLMGDPCSKNASGKYYVEMREDLNMSSLPIPKELPPLNPDMKAGQVAGRLGHVGEDGASPNAMTNRMGSTGNGSVGVPDAPDMKGANLPQGAPEGGVPDVKAGAPQMGAGGPQGGVPDVKGGAPQMGAPGGAGPQGGAPNVQGASQGAPQMGAPGAGGPQGGATQMGGPGGGGAPGGMQGRSMGDGAPQTDAAPQLGGGPQGGGPVPGGAGGAPKPGGLGGGGGGNSTQTPNPSNVNPSVGGNPFGGGGGSKGGNSTEGGKKKKNKKGEILFTDERKRLKKKLKKFFDFED